MFSQIRGSRKRSSEKEKFDCRCVSVPIKEKQDEDNKLVNMECFSQPGICILDDSGLCTKQDNAPHCSLTPAELIGEIHLSDIKNPPIHCKETCPGKRFHTYKIDLNNAEDTGLVADKQCQTCGPLCSAATCSNRTRKFFISWDRTRTRLLVVLIIVFGIWICLYVSIAATIS